MRTKVEIGRRIEEVRHSRPVGCRPIDRVLARALQVYGENGVRPRDLGRRLARLESLLRDDMPDLHVERGPRTTSLRPDGVALTVTEPMILDEARHRTIGARSHTIVLTASSVLLCGGILPGGAQPHLFERLVQRSGRMASLADVLLRMSGLWPTLLWMRARQCRAGRGEALGAIVTPCSGGLLFAAVEKVEGMPGTGTISAVVDVAGTRVRHLRDWYAEGRDRVWVSTKTYVGRDKLRPRQVELRDRLEEFTREYADVVAVNDWKWRVGFGQADVAVGAASRLLRLWEPSAARHEEAFDALERVVSSDLWRDEQRLNEESQARFRPVGLGTRIARAPGGRSACDTASLGSP